MKVRPEYFSWPLERRELYGAAMPKRDAASLGKALLKELFGKRCAKRTDKRGSWRNYNARSGVTSRSVLMPC